MAYCLNCESTIHDNTKTGNRLGRDPVQRILGSTFPPPPVHGDARIGTPKDGVQTIHPGWTRPEGWSRLEPPFHNPSTMTIHTPTPLRPTAAALHCAHPVMPAWAQSSFGPTTTVGCWCTLESVPHSGQHGRPRRLECGPPVQKTHPVPNE